MSDDKTTRALKMLQDCNSREGKDPFTNTGTQSAERRIPPVGSTIRYYERQLRPGLHWTRAAPPLQHSLRHLRHVHLVFNSLLFNEVWYDAFVERHAHGGIICQFHLGDDCVVSSFATGKACKQLVKKKGISTMVPYDDIPNRVRIAW